VLGENWVVVEDIASRYSRIVLAIAIVVIVAFIVWRVVRLVRRRRAAAVAGGDSSAETGADASGDNSTD
jgi:flagellar biosynthesis/type III secretory pathway M-ring protein FliF/YscJ